MKTSQLQRCWPGIGDGLNPRKSVESASSAAYALGRDSSELDGPRMTPI
jgi:hypothetical protein